MKTDVLIIGGGLTGLCAAYEITRNSDLRVDLLQWGAGASAYIHGFCLPLLEQDSEALFFEDSMVSGYRQSRESLVRALCRGSMELPAWFAALGVTVDADENGPRLIKSLGSSVPRIAGIGNNTGPVMCSTLRKKLAATGRYAEHRNLRALELVKKEGAVVGARCYDKDTDTFRTVCAGLVILATGGFGKLFPESTNSPDIGGDGCAMAYLAGCKLTDMEFVQFEPSAAVWPEALVGKSIITTMFYEGAVLRGGDGERFMHRYYPEAERVSKDLQARAIAAEIRRGNATAHGGVWFDATAVPEAMWEGIYKPYRNRYLAHGIDMRTEPVEIAPAAHTTCGGVLIDENCHTGIAGLIACGEVTGGLHGANRLGGNAGLETMVFGRIAGKAALQAYAPCAEMGEDVAQNRMPSVEVAPIRQQLQSVLRTKLGVIRTEAELEDGLRQIDSMLAALPDHENCYELHRLYNDLLTAKMAMASALYRKGSVGCHYRSDAKPEDRTYRIVIKNTADGFTLSDEPV